MRSRRQILKEALVLLVGADFVSACTSYKSLTIFHLPTPRRARIDARYLPTSRAAVSGYHGSFATQEYEDDCWAAAIESVLGANGVRVSQKDIIRRIVPRDRGNHTATQGDVVRAMNQWQVNAYGGGYVVSATEFQANAIGIIQDLEQGWPLIAGIRKEGSASGHVVVVTGVEYVVPAPYQPVFTSFEIFDPFPGCGDDEIDADEFDDIKKFIIRFRVQHF